MGPCTVAGVVCLVAYLLAVRRKRYANVRRLEQKYAHLLVNPEKMTYPEAHDIHLLMPLYDMPFFTVKALEFALFQTYAVPTISSLLVKTGRLGTSSGAARRAEDTAALIHDFSIHGTDSTRGARCIARMNFLHAQYGDKISRDDLLFTLSLFIFEPLRLTTLYEWRNPTPLEARSRFVFWREVGARMGIADLPHTPEELMAWKIAFEAERMPFAPSNAQVGNTTMNLFLEPYPALLRPCIRQVLLVLVPEHVRIAFGWEPARPTFLYAIIPALLRVRALVIRYFFFPRSYPDDWGLLDPGNVCTDAAGNTVYHRTKWLYEPFYVKRTFTNSLWGLLGLPIPGPQYRDDGYLAESMGPEELRFKNVAEVKRAAEEMQLKADGGRCPFAI